MPVAYFCSTGSKARHELLPVVGITHLWDRILPVRRFISMMDVTEMSTGAAPHVPVRRQSTRAESPAGGALLDEDEEAGRSSIWSRWIV